MSRFIMVLGVFLLAGCGRSGPELVPVDGTVYLGEKPLAFKSLVFIPVGGTVGNGAGGFTNGDGKYVLNAVIFGALKDYEGCLPGRYCVVVSEPTIPITADSFGLVVDGEKEGASVVELPSRRLKSEIPAVYSSKQTTPLVVEVSEPSSQIDLKLTAEPRKRHKR